MYKINYIVSLLLFIIISSYSFSQQMIENEYIIDSTNVVEIKHSSKPTTRILFIFDSSQSMIGRWDGRRKIDVARNLMIEILDSLRQIDDLEIGLRVYGHQSPVPPQDCSDTRLEVPFDPDNFDDIEYVLNGLVAKGTTPIARSLEEGAYDFPDDKFARNIVIMITDGIEACDGDPCAVSLALQSKGVILKPFIIGLGLDVKFKDVFECVGFYFDASNSKEFRKALSLVLDQALNYTSVQVNLLDTDGNPTETNVAMSFHDNLSGSVRYNYMHTINESGNPDTVLLDIMSRYDMKIHTIPAIELDSIELDPGKHNIISVDAPQGFLKVEIKGEDSISGPIKCIVRKAGDCNTLNIQDVNSTHKYITGQYDIEVLSIPRMNFKDVNISQSKLNKIQLPEPGVIDMHFDTPVIGSILHETGDNLEKVYTLDPNKLGTQLSLLPGRYRLVYRHTKDKKTKFTVEKRFDIKSGQRLEIKTN